nr:RNA-directed DNA polymerase, eukaryota, reverse transcriptase zinc-binding domain protein [Tanacetum cinerariifolium]
MDHMKMICMGVYRKTLKMWKVKVIWKKFMYFEEVPDKSIFEGNSVRQNDVHSEDPFDIYEGDVPVEKVDNWSDENRVNDGQEDGESLNSRKSILKAELADLDGVIDKGEGLDVDGYWRREVVRLIQKVEKVDAMEVAQKAKIEWSIEGDENSKYYHGVLNKKRGRLTIRGILVDGIWIKSPHLVKHEFFEHFKNRFEKPNKSRILLEMDFVKRISLEHNDDLERGCLTRRLKGRFGIVGFSSCKWKSYEGVLISQRVVDAGLFNGIKLDSSLQISHLFYADDTIFMGQWSQCNIDTIIRVLDVFYHATGLRINMNKSNLMGISVDSNKVKHAAVKIGCLVLKTPFNYLGSRVGDLMSR